MPIRFRTYYLKKRFWVLFLVILGLGYGYHALEFRVDDETYLEILTDAPFDYTPKLTYHEIDNRRIRSIEIGADSLPLVMFIHGSPASSVFWQDYLVDSTLLARAKLVAVDRPGYGYSGFGNIITSVKKQAALIAPILAEKREQHDMILLHGSSYGGTVAARLAMDYPDLVDGIIFQSSSLAPGEETTFWITYPTSHWSLSWLLPPSLRNANMEKLSHRLELQKMEKLWDRVTAAVTILHGDADQLIWPSNADFAMDKLKNALYRQKIIVEGRGHDLAFTAPELIKTSIINTMRVVEEQRAVKPEKQAE